MPELSLVVTNRPKSSIQTTTTTTTTTAITKIIQHKISNEELCFYGDGHYADLSTSCKEYYVCVFSGTPVVKVIRLRCPGSRWLSFFLFLITIKKSLCVKAYILNHGLKFVTNVIKLYAIQYNDINADK